MSWKVRVRGLATIDDSVPEGVLPGTTNVRDPHTQDVFLVISLDKEWRAKLTCEHHNSGIF